MPPAFPTRLSGQAACGKRFGCVYIRHMASSQRIEKLRLFPRIIDSNLLVSTGKGKQ
jgi:hypothetical protein